MIRLYYIVLFGLIGWYLLAFGYETVISLRRLGRPAGPNRLAYVDATWEITHTILVFAFTLFMITFSAALPALAPRLFWPLLLTGVALALRAALYLYIFYIRPPRHQQIAWPDYWFAASHLAVMISLLVTVLIATTKLWALAAVPNLAFFGSLIPGLAIVLIVSAIPLVRLYRQRSS